MTDAGLILRPARAFDAAACGRIVNAWIDATPWMPRIHPPSEVARFYREQMIPRHIVTVAEVAGEVAGFLVLDADEAEVTSLFVGPKGRGIGTALIARAKAGRDRLQLWTFEANEAARRFYLREGFTQAGRSPGDNEESLPDVQYVWTAP